MDRGMVMLEDDDTNINITDVIEVISKNDPSFKPPEPEPIMATPQNPKGPYPKAHVVIVEQPASKAMRFRYECEGRSAGSIPGQNSTPENKTYPTIKVIGYEGKAVVVVSCVTKDDIQGVYRPHPHNLVGKEGCRRGVCTVEIPSDTMTVSFSNLGIRCVKKKDIEQALKEREEIRVDPFSYNKVIKQGVIKSSSSSSIDLNAVRLCFQVFLELGGKFQVPLPPIVSEPIYDKKAMSDLQIFQLSSEMSSVAGGQKILLFCEKVTKDDIAVRFFEEKDGKLVWEGFADFQPSDVHRQVGIAFTTPRYATLEVKDAVNANIQLYRPSDKATSDPLRFVFTPLEQGRVSFWSRRNSKKGDSSALSEIFNSILAADNKINLADKTENLVVTTSWEQPPPELNNNVEEKSLNDLISQVAELDEIYSDTQARLLENPVEEKVEVVVEEGKEMEGEVEFDDTTYSSLQMAFKNPIDMLDKFEESVISAQGPVIDLVSPTAEKRVSSEKLPPLPPKRIKKLEQIRPISIYSSNNSITLSTEQAQSLLGSNSSLVRKPVSRAASFNVAPRPPQKLLPATPSHASTTTLPNPKKKGFFDKLFRRGSKKSESSLSVSKGSVASFKSLRDNQVPPIAGGHMKTLGANKNTGPDVIHISLKGPLNDEVTKPEVVHDIDRMDLTEAEHYALYTAMAPHATQKGDSKRKRVRVGSDSPKTWTKVQHMQDIATKSSSPSFGGIINLPESSIKVEPREIQNKMFGGSLSPYSPVNLEAPMQYRVPPLSVSPASYSQMEFTENYNYSPNPPMKTFQSPEQSLDGMTNPQHWNVEIKWDPNLNINSNQFQEQNWNTFNITPAVPVPMDGMNNLDDPGPLGSVLNLDSGDLQQLNSTDLANNLSVFECPEEGISNLNISNVDNEVQNNGDNNNMTDSLTRIANSAINEICNLNQMSDVKK